MLRSFLLFLAGLLIAVALAAALGYVKLDQFQKMGEAQEAMTIPPTVVSATEVESIEWQPRLHYTGSVEAVRGTLLSTELGGIVRSIRFESGAYVEKGKTLLTLDTDLERVQLDDAEVAADLASRVFKRSQELKRSRNIAQEAFDEAESNVKRTRAQVELLKTRIDKKTIRAPFSGYLGLRRISIGQFLQPGAEVVSLQSLEPVYIEFSAPQSRLSQLQPGLEISARSEAWPEQQFVATISAVSPAVDSMTRTVRVQAVHPNSDQRLRPGMAVKIQLDLAETRSALIVPLTAISHGPAGDMAFVIEPQEDSDTSEPVRKLRQQKVELGATRGDFIEVLDGLREGDQVVSTGVFKLAPGMQVVVDNRLAPQFSLDPNPDNS